LEQARAERAWAVIFTQNGDVLAMRAHLETSLQIADDHPNSIVLRNTASFTRAFAVYLSIRAADVVGEGPERTKGLRNREGLLPTLLSKH
jgi:hypothetical protein